MASSSNRNVHPNDWETPYPHADLLPAFRVRHCRETGYGIVRMSRDEYDQLLKRQPRAALRYLDEADGEVILVGSSFELDQRLQEKIVVPLPASWNGDSQTPPPPHSYLHLFDIERDPSVVQEWRQLDERTRKEGNKAREIFFGRAQVAPSPQPPPPPPKGKEKNQEVRFGEVSPPRSSLKTSPPASVENAHTSRWASYSSLPGSLDKEAVPLTTKPTPSNAPTEQQQQPVQHQTAQSHVRSSTLQIPATPKQQNEHKPLLDMFYSEQDTAEPVAEASTAKIPAKEWQPLLSLFENQLVELADQTNENKQGSPSSPKTQFAQKSGELLSQSIQSLLNGVGLLAATFKKTNAELQQQIALAQQDFPNNMDKALKASLAAIDSLRSMIPATKSEEQVQALDNESNESPATAGLPLTPAEMLAKDAFKAKTLSNRYKLQRHLLQPRQNQKEADLQGISDLLEELEIQTVTGNITPDVLIHSKIHKVLKRISRSSRPIPGDQKYRLRQRSFDIVQVWMTMLDKHRRAMEGSQIRHHDNAKEVDQPSSMQTSESSAQAVKETEDQTKESTVLYAEPAKERNQQIQVVGSGQDEYESDRVEKAIETMRRDLLLLGLLPPAEKVAATYYTRSDVLEAYISKFKELQLMNQLLHSPKPTVSHAATSTHVEVKSSGTQGGIVRDDDAILEARAPAINPIAAPRNPKSNETTITHKDSLETLHSAFLRQRNTFPSGSVEVGNKDGKLEVASSDAPGSNQRPVPPPKEPIPSAESKFVFQASPNVADSSATGSNMQPRVIRERNSWHPTSSDRKAKRAGPYPFDTVGFSPAAAMQRYPPVAQIHPSMYRQSFPALPHRPAHLDDRNDADNADAQSKRRLMPKHFTSIQDLRQRKEPVIPGQAAGAAAPWDRLAPPAASQSSVQRREHDRQTKEQETARMNMRKCIHQLVEMGFTRGKAEAVSHATLGNLEMALDVLNEDSAAWQAKAKAEEETARRQDTVPGSWGPWDDELYG